MVLRELATKGKSGLFARLVQTAGDLLARQKRALVSDTFDSAFEALKCDGWRDEYVYRAALTQKILMGRHNLRTACMLSEFRVGSCKADIAILNGTTTVYEIKSERDSLARLENQIENYRKVFASVYVIAGETHVESVLKATSPDVGVVSLSRRFHISTRREAHNDPSRVCPNTVFDALRTAEIQAILADNGQSVTDVPNTRLRAELRKKFVSLAPTVIHSGMLRTLKRTRDIAGLESLTSKLPESLHAAALSVPLRKADHDRLVEAVNTPLVDAMAWA